MAITVPTYLRHGPLQSCQHDLATISSLDVSDGGEGGANNGDGDGESDGDGDGEGDGEGDRTQEKRKRHVKSKITKHSKRLVESKACKRRRKKIVPTSIWLQPGFLAWSLAFFTLIAAVLFAYLGKEGLASTALSTAMATIISGFVKPK